jgi:hypothetical protein
MPLSTDEFILTHMVDAAAGTVDPEPVAIAIRTIVRASPCSDPAWSDIEVVVGGTTVQELTIATPFGELVPVARG